jgi:signal transduction histidine kinase
VEISIVNIKIDQQRHIIAVIHDISQRKKLEEEKIAALKQLQQAQKMEALGLLAGGVAHDLNNVLSGLVSYPELLLMDLPDDSPLRSAVLTIQDSGKKASYIVEDLLALSRRGVVNTQIFNLNTVINEYIKSIEFKTLHQYHPNLTVHTSLQPDLHNMSGTSMHLRKTIMNLMSNAAEAMPQGGSVLISTENRYLDAPLQEYDKIDAGNYIILTVQDTGEGIDPDHQKRIFEPFYTTKTMGRSGTGLGLSVIWGTVQDHNGYIHIHSSPGNGTTFELYFPAKEEQIEQDAGQLSISDYTGRGESILVIDDVKDQREIARRLLSRLNYKVKTISSGEEAIEYMNSHHADLIILDMIMKSSGMDGLETYRQILKVHPGQKAIITSGFSDNDRVREAQRLGAGDYVKKPYTLDTIGMAVKKELAA